MNHFRVILALLLFSFALIYKTGAQEYVTAITGYPKKESNQSINNRSITSTFLFEIDTLSLPFVDDFSSNRIKSYSTDTSTIPFRTDSSFNFLVDNRYKETLNTLRLGDTSFLVDFNQVTEVFDTVPLTPYTITTYNNALYPPIPLDTLEYWPNYSLITDSFGQIDTVFLLEIDTTWTGNVNTFITLVDDNSLWMNPESQSVYINDHYGIQPPSLGVATFDAIDADGSMYSSASEFLFYADELTSKPIDLSGLNPIDSIYVSFFFQPQGLGDFPSLDDSLQVQFRSLEKDWTHQWSMGGMKYADFVDEYDSSFQQVMIPVTDSAFFDKGFQIRFRNLASLASDVEPSWASNADHWHIDYVRIDVNRTIGDRHFEDVAFQHAPSSVFEDFTQIPWEHFVNGSNFTIKPTLSNRAINNDNATTPKNVTYDLEINDPNSTFFTSGNYTVNLDALSAFNFTANTNGLAFNNNGNDSGEFVVKHILSTDANDNKINDTLIYHQNFYQAYAYDDGSAEAGYGISSIGGKLAYRFDPVKDGEDTLQAIQIYFNQVMNDANVRQFNLTVWNSNNSGPGDIIYQSEPLAVTYSDDLNKFVTFELDTTVIINGTFYIGWEQNHEDLLNVGFDQNASLDNKLYFSIASNGGIWAESSFDGALMMRPIVGAPLPEIVSIPTKSIKKETAELKTFPNPSNGILHLSLDNQEIFEVEIYSLSGVLVKKLNYRSGDTIYTNDLAPAVYLVVAQNKSVKDQQLLIVN